MATLAGRQISIVVGFDFSPLADLALRDAAALAGRHARATIHVVTVGQDIASAASPPRGTTGRIRSRVVAAIRAAWAGSYVHIVSHLRAGDPASEILSVAEDVQADVIVVGTHGRRGVKRLLLGSVAEHVVRGAQCQVVVARPRRYEPHPERSPEPPCEACVELRRASNGRESWCPVHVRPWAPPHRYTYASGALGAYHPDGLG